MMIEINKDLHFLRKKSKKVDEINHEINELIFRMGEAMRKHNGIGLAACQIGELKRVVIMKNNDNFISLINPVITKKSKDKSKMEEGCLSLPGCLLETERSNKITVNATDLNQNTITLNLNGIEARVIQHEVDHLDGILITDRRSLIEKIKRKFKRKF